ncbi:MAG: hypothetical protein QXO28_04350, partial [Ignisphaera sp.]
MSLTSPSTHRFKGYRVAGTNLTSLGLLYAAAALVRDSNRISNYEMLVKSIINTLSLECDIVGISMLAS